jgi:hypothetical protein
MPVTTRRRSAAIAANANRSALKSSPSKSSTRRRDSQTPPPPIITKEPLRSKKTGKIIGQPRRKKSLPAEETHEIACRFGHRLYEGEALLSGKATISPILKNLMDAGGDGGEGVVEGASCCGCCVGDVEEYQKGLSCWFYCKTYRAFSGVSFGRSLFLIDMLFALGRESTCCGKGSVPLRFVMSAAGHGMSRMPNSDSIDIKSVCRNELVVHFQINIIRNDAS